MPHPIYELRRIINERIWWPLGRFSDVVHPVPLVGGYAILLVLSSSGQLHEVYAAHLESNLDIRTSVHVVTAAVCLSLLSAALYFANHSLSKVKLDILWAEHRDVDREYKLRLIRDGSGAVAAVLPWIGLTVGLWESYALLNTHIATLELTSTSFVVPPDVRAIIADLQRATSTLRWTLFLTALAGAAIVLSLHWLRHNGGVRAASLALIAILFVTAAALPPVLGHTNMTAAVSLFRLIGPFSMAILDTLLLFSFVAALTLLSRGAGFPVLTLLVLIALLSIFFGISLFTAARFVTVLFLLIGILALLSWKWRLALVSLVVAIVAALICIPPYPNQLALNGSDRNENLENRYAEWLKSREGDRAVYRARSRGAYPVFIIAAEGGGIYAAAAASAFLSRLQDLCPNFAQHVFAISGVSGGAFGATAFQAMTQGLDVATAGCQLSEKLNTDGLSQKTADVIQADHLSPLLGFLVPDLLNTFEDRAKGLEQSLITSIEQADNGRGTSRAPYNTHWRPDKAAPALVLNATSVESGYRVAFAPFSLDGLGGGSLYSFSDFSKQELSLAGAAVVSARFPGILPAFSMSQGGRHLNLVDGGYSDASGAFTALDLFSALKPLTPDGVELRLILLTSARSKLKISQLEETSARDTLTPFVTLLNVRGVFWEIAVAHTIAAVDPRNARALQELTSPAQEGADDWNAALVQIDEQSFALSLGWRISPTTQKIISLLMGEPRLCIEQNMSAIEASKNVEASAIHPEKEEASIASRTLLANSCVMRSITNLLSLPDQAAK
jgi:hypothetical protein